MRRSSLTAVAAIVVTCHAGCVAHVQIPEAPPATAPVEDRIAWAKRYNLVELGSPRASGFDQLGTTETVYDLRDLGTGISDDRGFNLALQALDGPSFNHTIASWTTIGGAAVFLGGYITANQLEEEYGAEATPTVVASVVTLAGLVGVVGGFLWSGVAGADLARTQSRVRLMYSHVIEDRLDVEIHPDGDVTARASAATTSVTTANPPPATIPAPETAPLAPPATTPPLVTPDAATTTPTP